MDDREDRQERDRFLEAVMEHVGLPLARVRVRKRYNPEEIRTLMENHLPGLPYPGHRRGAS
ncbi:DUF2726 domain-containing protein [Thermus sp. SYSU G05001]|uniref:DUF2726 domain-containing protein n=1 Tax=Thermus brevis TaxID=2862456 RepID=A0ABS6ZXR6_9DEIN|nr:DUF2726 domain-containing protein [Thermus brevis]MBW6394620.1 DUF2726 domain-containing protein [Thermus brevis]